MAGRDNQGMIAAILGENANDVLTAILVIATGAVIRGLWSLQQRISRLEALDEMKERLLDKDRDQEADT